MCVQLQSVREKVRGSEIEALRTRNELKGALMSVNELTHEVSASPHLFRDLSSVRERSLGALFTSNTCRTVFQNHRIRGTELPSLCLKS